MMVVVAYLMVDASSSETTADTNVQVLNIPSCEHFTSQLYYYCSYDDEQQSKENPLITSSHLNTDRISENVCGKYDSQGVYVYSYANSATISVVMYGIVVGMVAYEYIICPIHSAKLIC